MTTLPPLVEPGPELSRKEIERYSRHLTLAQVGPLGQRRLKNARVLVVGAGGLGSPALQYLAAAGVGAIGVVDDDEVALSNLQRQVVHGVGDIGRPKTESAAEAVARLNPLVKVVTHPVRLTEANAHELVSQYDLVLDGADNFATRYLVSDACALAGVPCVWGSILRFEGRVAVFWAGRGPTYRDLHPEPPRQGEVPSCAEGGVLGALPATIGAVMVTEAVKLITGAGESLLGRVLLHDALAMTWRELRLVPDPAAPPVVEVSAPEERSSGPADDDGPLPHEVIGTRELVELLERRERGEASFALVDVRDDWERELVSIPGSIPVSFDALLAQGMAALPGEARGELVLHCKAGPRSTKALAVLRPQYAGREERVRHLDGGVLAWVQQVEPHLPTY